MKKQILWFSVLCLMGSVGTAQHFGDQATAGFDNSRTYASNAMRTLKPPLRLFDTILLDDAEDATSLAVFNNRYLVGQADGSINYRLFNPAGQLAWTATLNGGGSLDFVPAYAQGIVILGGDNTSSIRAVNVTNGAVLWTANMGATTRRYPVLTDNLAIYAGADGIAAANAATGQVFWQIPVTTAEAPISVFGNRVYFLEESGAIHSLDLRTGAPAWSAAVTSPNGATVLPTEDYVFVAAGGTVNSLHSATGLPAWSAAIQVPGTLAGPNALAFAGGRLLVFRSDNGDGEAAVAAYNPDSGAALWEITESVDGLQFGFVAGNTIYYHHQPTGRIRARDLATGALLWSIPGMVGLQALTAANDSLVALVNGDIEIYRHSPEAYLAHMASGLGQFTLLALSNPSDEEVSATVEFFNDQGNGLSVPVEGVGVVDELLVTVPAGSSKLIRINSMESGVVTGWIRVIANQRIRASSIYGFAPEGDVTHEAGVGDASATGSGNVVVTVDDDAVSNTGIAIANPTEEEAEITLTLLDANGQELDQVTFEVGSLGHVAQFFNEWFSGVPDVFAGTVVIESDVPITVVALRTKDLLQMSSYPIGQPAQ